MPKKQIITHRNPAHVILIMSSTENSQERMQISPEFHRNHSAKNTSLEKTLKGAKEALKAECNRLLDDYNKKLKECAEEDRKTGLLIDAAIELATKNLEEEKAFFKQVEDAAEESNNANFKYLSKCKTFLEMSKKNKRGFDHLIKNLTTEQEGESSCKVRKM